MLGRKIFSILSLLALTVLLGACGSEEQTVAVQPSVDTVVETQDSQIDQSQIDTQKQVASSIMTETFVEFADMVDAGEFVSVEDFKSLNGMTTATTVHFYFQECSGGTADIYDADEDSGFWGNLLDRITPGVNYGSCNKHFSRTASGNYVTRSDDFLSKAEVLAAMKEIVANGTPVRSMGQAAYAFLYNKVTYTIDLNYPVEINPVIESHVDSEGKTNSSSFIGTYWY